MTGRELIEFQLEDSGYQLEQVLAGFPEAALGAKLSPEGMSAVEAIEHLSEAYEAMIAHNEGRKHSWGTFAVADKSTANLMKVWKEQRASAISGGLADGSDEALKNLCAYVVGHDYYHVGQLCALRLHVDPSFDAYSIYRH